MLNSKQSNRYFAVGVVASKDGRELDLDATVARIASEIEARGTGRPSANVGVALATIQPKMTTEEAQKIAPVMVKLGTDLRCRTLRPMRMARGRMT